MRKNLDVKLSWMSDENWDAFIEAGYLPILAINHPGHHGGTRIHFPELAPKMRVLRKFDDPLREYQNWITENINKHEVLRIIDILAHLACADGVVILTEKEDDPFRVVLGEFLDGILDNKITEYEWPGRDSRDMADN